MRAVEHDGPISAHGRRGRPSAEQVAKADQLICAHRLPHDRLGVQLSRDLAIPLRCATAADTVDDTPVTRFQHRRKSRRCSDTTGGCAVDVEKAATPRPRCIPDDIY
jgi:hypothetical protein